MGIKAINRLVSAGLISEAWKVFFDEYARFSDGSSPPPAYGKSELLDLGLRLANESDFSLSYSLAIRYDDALVDLVKHAKEMKDLSFFITLIIGFKDYRYNMAVANVDFAKIFNMLGLPSISPEEITDPRTLSKQDNTEIFLATFRGNTTVVKRADISNNDAPLDNFVVDEAFMYAYLQLFGQSMHIVTAHAFSIPGTIVEEAGSDDLYKWRMSLPKYVGLLTLLEYTFYTCHQVASALQYLHTRGVIYADLKAPNILVMQGGAVKLCDLGNTTFAEEFEAGNNLHHIRQATITYAAPEILAVELNDKGKENFYRKYSAKIGHSYSGDIYALGLIMEFLLLGGEPNSPLHTLTEAHMQKNSNTAINPADARYIQAFAQHYLDAIMKKRANGKPRLKAPFDMDTQDLHLYKLYKQCYKLASRMLAVKPEERVSALRAKKEAHKVLKTSFTSPK